MRIIFPPLKWDKNIDGLDNGDCARWRQDYERGLLPPETVFPRKGQIWETLRDCEVGFQASIEWPDQKYGKLRLADGSEVTVADEGPLTHFSPGNPRHPFGMAQLSKGEKVRIVEGPHFSEFAAPKPLRVSLLPLRYDELHENIVPHELRSAPGYKGYRLNVRTARPRWVLHEEKAYLNQDFKLVEAVV
jgi:hypothetical protein